MKAKLVSVDPWSPQLDFEVEDWPVVIGSNGHCNIAIVDRWVGKRHCEISQENGHLVVRDLGSNCGTLVEGQPVQLAPLLPNQILTVGIRMLRVSYRLSTRQQIRAGKGERSADVLTV